MEKHVSPRETTLKILYDIEYNDAYANLALKKYLKNTDYKVVDRGLITELVYGILKFKLKIDYIIRQFSNIRIKKISPWILNVLRIGVYQIIYLDRVPDSAACNESVKLAKKYGHYGSVKFVNGLLRNVSRQKTSIVYPDRNKDILEYLSIYYSHPKWMVQGWLEQYGLEFTEQLCKANNEVADLTARVNTLKVSPEKLKEYLEKEGVQVKTAHYCDEAVILEKVGNIDQLNAFNKGFFQVQDESSMLASKVLAPCANDMIIDVCCAPGGKTTHIAQLMENKGEILGWDIHEHKIHLVQTAAKRLGINIIQAQAKDATIELSSLREKADKVLVDAPCSGLGIIRRKPDIKWNKCNDNLEDIVTLQKNILRVSSNYVKPGGILVYSTCTIRDEENIDIINDFIKENPEFILQNIEPYLPQNLHTETTKQGYVQLFPNIHRTDGFFICKMKRKA